MAETNNIEKTENDTAEADQVASVKAASGAMPSNAPGDGGLSRALNEGATGKGAELVGAEIYGTVLEKLKAKSVFMNALPAENNKPMKSGVLNVPVWGDGEFGDWYNEGELIASEESGLSTLELKAKKLGSRVGYTQEVSEDSSVDVQAEVTNKVIKDLSRKLDKAFLNGDGDIKTPKGIFKLATPAPITSAVTIEDIRTGIFDMIADDGNPSALFIAPDVFKAISGEKDEQKRYIIDPTAQGPMAGSLFGVPLYVSSHVPAKQVGIIDMSAVNVGLRRDLSIVIDPWTDRAKEITTVHVSGRFAGVAITDTKAVKVIAGK
ncbi:phage major capsid protein [Streptomyces sp. HUAS TT7]|uniref:phage major capsid protein n=1 Tax=Streptomyces sp. HUAS TT7 TaxID=3447507 RepID=UPI003F65E9BC